MVALAVLSAVIVTGATTVAAGRDGKISAVRDDITSAAGGRAWGRCLSQTDDDAMSCTSDRQGGSVIEYESMLQVKRSTPHEKLNDEESALAQGRNQSLERLPEALPTDGSSEQEGGGRSTKASEALFATVGFDKDGGKPSAGPAEKDEKTPLVAFEAPLARIGSDNERDRLSAVASEVAPTGGGPAKKGENAIKVTQAPIACGSREEGARECEGQNRTSAQAPDKSSGEPSERISAGGAVHHDASQGSKPIQRVDDLSLLGVSTEMSSSSNSKSPFGDIVTTVKSSAYAQSAANSATHFKETVYHLGISRVVQHGSSNHFSNGAWACFFCSSVSLVIIDWVALRRLPCTRWTHVMVLTFWALVAALYNAYVTLVYGGDAGYQWATGYVLEWLLSMDNLFVFHVVFRVYRAPNHLVHKALFFGIVGALFFRGLSFTCFGVLLGAATWVKVLLGVALVYSGLAGMLRNEPEIAADDVAGSNAVRALEWCLGDRLQAGGYDDEGRIFVYSPDGKTCISLFAFVVMTLELTDAMFAFDSVTAKLALIPDIYIAFSSSALAMFGLRAMFFIIQDLAEACSAIEYGLLLILIFIGLQLIFSPWLHLYPAVCLLVILAIFLVCTSVGGIMTVMRKQESST